MLQVAPDPATAPPLTATDCADIAWSDAVDGWMWVASTEAVPLTAGATSPAVLVGGDPARMFRPQVALVGVDGIIATPSPFAVDTGNGASRLLSGGRTLQLAVASGEHLGPLASGSLMVLSPEPARVDACLFHARDGARAELLTTVQSRLPITRGFVTRWGMPSADEFEAPELSWRRRASQHVWRGAALLLAAVMLGATLARRRELALYRVLSPRKATVAAIVAIEALILCLVASLAAIAVVAASMTWHDIVGAVRHPALASTVRFTVAISLVGPAWSALAVPLSADETITDLRA